ncbi:transposase, partial [Microcystis elabens FACHB-917]|nr:transposase [Microcystis elabens FACHB-917]
PRASDRLGAQGQGSPRSHQGRLARQRLDRGADHHNHEAQRQAQGHQALLRPPADCVYITTIRTTPEALLRLIRQRWSIENEWHRARDTQLDEDAHRYTNRIGASVFSFLRTIVLNLLRSGGYRSIRRGLRKWSTTSRGCWRWVALKSPKAGPG